ncbi:Cysteine-rich receptor-like protein kinase 17 [Camellia lanceoleosa]|uniref:Cysteine-rich receptor-like protein kinase 17 n=1 Tax=Camellia lanceoleosa TaxID=1840588 RepID=A0ACC0HXW7_9ERIC|nr:Cysteine-rich receptor-like protein kinase 17 [Camellia lanceoleosa]
MVEKKMISLNRMYPKSISCDSSPINYTPNSRFGNNLKILLESLSSNTPLNQGFNSIAIRNNTDQVYGQALCRGDVTPEVCWDCIKNASQEIELVD